MKSDVEKLKEFKKKIEEAFGEPAEVFWNDLFNEVEVRMLSKQVTDESIDNIKKIAEESGLGVKDIFVFPAGNFIQVRAYFKNGERSG